MNTSTWILTALLAATSGLAATTIDPAHNTAYGANIGWINAEGDVANGAVIGQAFCSGYLYSANVGWIHLGDGTPDNGIAYGNASATDCGVNHDGFGKLSGYAYGANVGWINFEQTHGKPKFSLVTGKFSGSVWGANVGWIGLGESLGYVATLTIDPGPDTDADNIPDAWELSHTNTLAALNGGDFDGDGVIDSDEYLAGTDPLDINDYLRITDFSQSDTADYVTWPAKAGRSYTLQRVDALSSNIVWNVAKPPFLVAGNTDYSAKVPLSPTNRFYRVEAEPPLSP